MSEYFFEERNVGNRNYVVENFMKLPKYQLFPKQTKNTVTVMAKLTCFIHQKSFFIIILAQSFQRGFAGLLLMFFLSQIYG